MSNKKIFLSHIHEEKDLALIIKNAIESEFSGFVDVFVSSDGTSIPAGTNFLKRIEDGLATCIGAIYLISPTSVKRNWINFELGAVWIRNAISLKSEGNEIPALPFCHSNMTPLTLPQPIGNLNAIIANQSSQLEFAFRSLQSAVGGKGALRTNFDLLAQEVIAFEKVYTLGASVKDLFSILDLDIARLIEHCESLPSETIHLNIELGFIPTEKVQKILTFENNELNGRIKLTVNSSGTSFGSQGSVNGANVNLLFEVKLINEFKGILQT